MTCAAWKLPCVGRVPFVDTLSVKGGAALHARGITGPMRTIGKNLLAAIAAWRKRRDRGRICFPVCFAREDLYGEQHLLKAAHSRKTFEGDLRVWRFPKSMQNSRSVVDPRESVFVAEGC